MTDTLIVIPVRSGSQGLPNKALRLLAGQSPLWRTLETARQIDADLVVASNDVTVLASCVNLGVQTVQLAPELTGSDVPLDAPVHFATQYMERLSYPKRYDVVVTMQCTSPFTTADTVRQAIAIASGDCTAITVRDDRGLRWESVKIGSPMLANRAPRRVVRQKMPAQWRETGAVFATPRRYVEANSRFGHVVQLVEVSGKEAIDLDTPEDWAIAEMYAGATERELLLAQVLMDSPFYGIAVVLSAWDEESGEQDVRLQRAALFPTTYEPREANTHEEARRAVADLKDRTRDLIIVTSAYHMPRAFLTFLQVLKDQKLERTVKLWCAPAPSKMDKLSGEWAKIAEYQAKGHVARYDEGLDYLTWRDAHQFSEPYACVA